jgi:imidazolonepropionase-like amidohydrolase
MLSLNMAAGKKVSTPNRTASGRKERISVQALASGVTICMGGDVGVYAHGDNAREMEMMADYGMKPLDVFKSATSVNADVFGISNRVGRIRPGLLADLLVVDGDPSVIFRRCVRSGG